MTYFPRLGSPLPLKGLTIPNRIMMAAMATSFAGADGGVSEQMIAYYRRRARGGAGLLVVENANVDFPDGISGGAQLRVDRDRFTPGLFRLSEAIHLEGALCALQINHAGALAKNAAQEGGRSVAPSEGPAGLYFHPVRSLEHEEIAHLVEAFAEACLRAKQAGFDAVEIHGAHAYLISQFLSPLTNQRADEYGGDTAGRARFALEVVAAARARLGPDYPIFFRLNAAEFMPGGLDPAESADIAARLAGAGVDLLDLTMGTHYRVNRSFCSLLEPMSYDQGWRLKTVARVKKGLPVPVAAVGPFRDPGTAEAALERGSCDLVCLGRPLIADPDWPAKALSGRSAEIRHCISCNEGCVRRRIFEKRPVACTVNPRVGWEYAGGDKRAPASLSLLVVGGGPAGCTAAILAARRGHQVALLEKSDHLGGNCLLASRLAHKEILARVSEHQARELAGLGVRVHLGADFSPQLMESFQPQILVWATGAEPLLPRSIELEGKPLFAEEVLREGMSWQGAHLAIIGGGASGCELALTLAGGGNRVTILEALAEAAPDLEPISRFDLLERMGQNASIDLLVSSMVTSASAGEVAYVQSGAGESVLACDQVIWAAGYAPRPVPDWLNGFHPGLAVHCIGDAQRPRNVFYAVRDGFMLGSRV